MLADKRYCHPPTITDSVSRYLLCCEALEVLVTHCGRICIGKRKIGLSRVFAGQQVGIREIEEKVWLVSSMHYDLGFFDHETGRVECAENPFQARVLPMPSE